MAASTPAFVRSGLLGRGLLGWSPLGFGYYGRLTVAGEATVTLEADSATVTLEADSATVTLEVAA